jgi:oligopeptide transport system permease protein
MITEIVGGNRINFQDQFNLQPGTFYYTIVPKGDTESKNHAGILVKLEKTIALAAAQNIDPQAKIGSPIVLRAHPMGTDYLGRDILSRLMAGGAVSLGIGFFAPMLSTLIGVIVGGIAGYFGGKVDEWLMRITDFVLALPFLLFIILFNIAIGARAGDSGITAMLVALVALSWTGPARFVRGQVLQLRETEFVQAAKLLGASPTYLIMRHLMPNTLGILLVSLTFDIPRAIFTEAFLSFIGMGVVPPTPSWGTMCNEGTQAFLTHPHEFFFPAAIISITVLAFNLLGDGLRDALDPRMRSVQ